MPRGTKKKRLPSVVPEKLTPLVPPATSRHHRAVMIKSFQEGSSMGSYDYRKRPPLYWQPGAFNICCPRDCVSRHNGGTAGAPLKPLRVDSALRDYEIYNNS